MRTWLLALGLALAPAACSRTEAPAPAPTKAAEIATVTVAELATRLASGACRAVDANGDETRAKLGVIPGAIRLSDNGVFDAGELPANKATPLVFYCTNTYCGASEEAAGRARVAGYTDVRVLPDGIAGWVKAGNRVEKI